jgi:hypothetical protein
VIKQPQLVTVTKIPVRVKQYNLKKTFRIRVFQLLFCTY